ncbi:hypothetical protein phiK7A1_145 [Pseudomonas phage phiK7A1]|uniref:Uncharacterized protein n=1 Tax=Pseudomonas phage phiK7A1 TaxID=2759194 RepID=A0A7H0XFZ3_9CAUD|nr:hypothetical protein phiK7A1_145 [Pseudomonas phage phiK7A1]
MTILKAEFIANYKAAEKRALPAANGVSFLEQDRITLDAQRRSMGLDTGQTAQLFDKPGTLTYAKAHGRLSLWKRQVDTGEIRLCVATGEHVGKTHSAARVQVVPFDGRIKTTADIQPAFNKAAVQLIKLGYTNPQEAAAFLVNGFQYAKDEQKIDTKADRLLGELRMGDLTKPQALAVLDRIKAQL